MLPLGFDVFSRAGSVPKGSKLFSSNRGWLTNGLLADNLGSEAESTGVCLVLDSRYRLSAVGPLACCGAVSELSLPRERDSVSTESVLHSILPAATENSTTEPKPIEIAIKRVAGFCLLADRIRGRCDVRRAGSLAEECAGEFGAG